MKSVTNYNEVFAPAVKAGRCRLLFSKIAPQLIESTWLTGVDCIVVNTFQLQG